MTEQFDVFLSYSRNDPVAAANLRAQLERHGLSVFKDDERIRAGDLWLERLQSVLDACSSFVVLVGRDGVRRWVGAETQAALNRHFAPHDDAERLPIFPILLEGTAPETLPAFLQLFQMTAWNGVDRLPDRLLADMRKRAIVANEIPFEGCPFVGLAAYRIDQAHLFFGRQKETLDALACFDTRRGRPPVRWLEINGNSGSGKSSLMNAGLLPLIDQGWLWPRSGYAHWRRIGPMMPGEHPVAMLAEHLARTFDAKMGEVCSDLQAGDSALRYWLRDRKHDGTAFLLAIDQFEELFTFADANERCRFDRLLATALEDPDCPLFVISTVRSDFLDRFAADLPRLVAVRNRLARPWTLAPIGDDGLREVIEGPARLAALEIGEVKEAMVAEARDEPGALPLVENALHWLWQQRTGNRLSGRLFNDQGGLAGILSRSADDLLDGLGKPQRDRALELLFRLVQVDPEGRRHTRRRIPLDEAIAVAGGSDVGRRLLNRLAGERARDGTKAEGPLRLITISEEGASGGTERAGPWVSLIHETLIRSRGLDAAGKPQPYWPTLWTYIEKNKERAARRERLQLMARQWKDRRGFDWLFGLAGWASLFGFRGLAARGSLEQRYLRWSRARAAAEAVVLMTLLAVISESVYWAQAHELPLEAVTTRWAYILGKNLPFPVTVPIPPESALLEAFWMGSDDKTDERPRHSVAISRRFYLAKTEITFTQYDAYANATGRAKPRDHGWGRGDQPVINVGWNEAREYARWLGAMKGGTCRLPSEAEWEFAARAGTASEYALPAPNGSDDIKGKALANCADCGSQWDLMQTALVGQFPANAWGLHDMHGNVWEWIEDCWHENYQDAPNDGSPWRIENSGNCFFRVMRGGSWSADQVNARSASRYKYDPILPFYNFGFRVVCSSPSSGTDH